MRARYTDLVQTNTAVRRQFRSEYEASQFDLSTTSNFAVFTHKSWRGDQTHAASKNWKAHISVHPEDLPKAWDLIYPLLYKHANQFKVVDLNKLNTIYQKHRSEYVDLESRRKALNDSLMAGTLERTALEGQAQRYLPAEEYRFIVGKRGTLSPEAYKKELFKHLDNQFATDLINRRVILEEDRRLAEGTQISIYMLPGEEEKQQKLYDEIEQLLIENKIRPGTPYATDRQLGHFVSIRHPGVSIYHDAVTATSYNPENQEDPFEEFFDRSMLEFEEMVQQSIQLLKSFKTHELMSETERHNTLVKNNLGIYLERILSEFQGKPLPEKIEYLEEFQDEFYDIVDEADSLLKNDSNKAIAKNIGLLFTGIGTLFALASLASRLVTGRYLFFDDKETVFTPPRPAIYSSPDPGSPSSIVSFEPENHVEKYKQQVSSIRPPEVRSIKERHQEARRKEEYDETEADEMSQSDSLKEPLLRRSSFNISSS